MARGSRGGGEAAGGRHHVAEGLLQQGAGAGGGGAGGGAETAVQHVIQTRHAATQCTVGTVPLLPGPAEAGLAAVCVGV